jgi:hypothetical protein
MRVARSDLIPAPLNCFQTLCVKEKPSNAIRSLMSFMKIVVKYDSQECTRKKNPCTAQVQRTHFNANHHHHTYRICFNCSFCWLVKLVGNLILTPIIKSPLSIGFLDFGIPKFGNFSVHVGPVGPPLATLSCLPSMVCTVRRHPVRASLRSSSMMCLMSSFSRVKRGWDF